MSIVVEDVTRVPENICEKLKKAAEDWDIKRLYELIAEDPTILGRFDNPPFCETPLHIAAEKGKTHFAMELVTLKPSLALKLNVSGFSPMHLALHYNNLRTVRGLLAIDSSLVSIKGRGRITPLHHVARIGDSDLLSEFLCSYPSSIEDLTIKCETAVHIAVKNHQFETFKVLLGWIKRANREEVLDWKDEDGNTVLHIAASTNQTEVMKLLRGTVKVNAKNLNDKTAKDILQTHKSSQSTTTLARYLSKKPSFIEKQNSLFGLTNLSKTRQRSLSSNDSRSVILVVAILIATATYQANLSPPGGFWQDDSKPGDRYAHFAGEMVMTFNYAIFFFIPNAVAFFSSLCVIVILTVGFPMWKVIYGSIAALGVANFALLYFTFPVASISPESSASVHTILDVFLYSYPVITGVIVFVPCVAFFLNKRRRRQVDFPERYFTSPHELS